MYHWNYSRLPKKALAAASYGAAVRPHTYCWVHKQAYKIGRNAPNNNIKIELANLAIMITSTFWSLQSIK
ncbi:hypothetical protein TorRG33x02_062560 [Trema orientale]|uniref:Uncharacterized protein n=1 Tax=Trema orientale TaxID=63057 RepID=A0A2P5FJG3_TREOI|nr:hypothetical protein TorRG33x02_062560 [Trema orientale]